MINIIFNIIYIFTYYKKALKYILRKNRHSNSHPSLSLFKITTKAFKGIKTRNTFREYRYL
ncbi:hypothetical protein B2H94_00785 [Clostridium sporogenes]|uniref:Uncharacterized protein n=1 Tax=Clostridium sporogenes TaxID=1509 RepID=A0ABD6RNT2_CLOSG|nr:hypothetical protein B2H94_00785 [Clostridium sporogenes]